MVSLTGDVATGKEVARAAAASLKRVHLELGGKAPVDRVRRRRPRGRGERASATPASTTRARTAPRRRASWSARGCTTTCSRRSCRQVSAIAFGDPRHRRRHRDGPARLDRAAASACSASSSARRRAAPQVRRGRRHRARSRRFFVEPTIVTGVAQDSEIVQREVFGPVVTVQRVPLRGRCDRLGERRRLRPRGLGLDARRRTGDARRASAPVRGRLDQHPRQRRVRDAPRRLQAVRLRQGQVDVRRRGVHEHQARHGISLD